MMEQIETKVKQNRLNLKIFIITFVFLCVSSIFVFAILPVMRDKIELIQREKTFDGDSNCLKSTVIVPVLDACLPAGKNVIWCSSFQLAWNELKNNIIKEPIKLKNAENLAGNLNNAKQTTNDIDVGDYFAAAGFVKDGIVEHINRQMLERFSREPSILYSSPNPNDIISYSYLQAYVKFSKPFIENDHEFLFEDSSGRKTSVTSFGMWDGFLPGWGKTIEQIEILYCSPIDYNEKDYKVNEFAIDLCKYTEPYQIVIAVIEKKETLAQTLENLNNKIKQFSKTETSKFDEIDVLIVPNMFWKIETDFDELENKNLANDGFEGYFIKKAIQSIEFRLDRSGAVLKSESSDVVAAIPKVFSFNKPFLIYIKKRQPDAQPFFVMWVDNAELLSKK
jgi:hypothetical protein